MIRIVLFAIVATCAKAPPDISACKELAEETYVFVIRRGATVLYRATREFMNFGFGSGSVEVFLRDLDADGHAEIVAADFQGMSNGISICYWTVTIIDGRTSAALSVPVEDYGEGTLRRDGLLVSKWEWIGDHFYFVGRPYRYEHGKLVAGKTMWQRRYLFSFERERNRSAVARPGQWLKRAARVPWRDPEPE